MLQAGTSGAEELGSGIQGLTEQAQQLEEQLVSQEQLLQQLQEGARGEVEQHTQALQDVRRQLAPWEQQISQVQSRLAVATAEQDMLQKSHTEAKQRLQVHLPQSCIPFACEDLPLQPRSNCTTLSLTNIARFCFAQELTPCACVIDS